MKRFRRTPPKYAWHEAPEWLVELICVQLCGVPPSERRAHAEDALFRGVAAENLAVVLSEESPDLPGESQLYLAACRAERSMLWLAERNLDRVGIEAALRRLGE